MREKVVVVRGNLIASYRRKVVVYQGSRNQGIPIGVRLGPESPEIRRDLPGLEMEIGGGGLKHREPELGTIVCAGRGETGGIDDDLIQQNQSRVENDIRGERQSEVVERAVPTPEPVDLVQSPFTEGAREIQDPPEEKGRFAFRFALNRSRADEDVQQDDQEPGSVH